AGYRGGGVKTADKARRNLLLIEIPRDELALRIAEKCIGLHRPDGLTSSAALAQLAAEFRDIVTGWRAAADAAVAYFHERIMEGRQPS
ncbi:MAG: hypothetical protein QM605_13580, partial [Sphingobium sp.]